MVELWLTSPLHCLSVTHQSAVLGRKHLSGLFKEFVWKFASALNREKMTQGAALLIDSLESGKPDVGGGRPDVLARCC